MARLKSEVLQIQYEKNGVSRRDRLVRDSVKYSGRFSGVLAATVNRLQDTSIFRTTIELFGGFDKRRALPAYSSFTFKEWFKSNYADRGHNRRVGLFADTYLNYHEPQIGISAVGLIQALGWDIDLLEGCCQRPKISHG